MGPRSLDAGADRVDETFDLLVQTFRRHGDEFPFEAERDHAVDGAEQALRPILALFLRRLRNERAQRFENETEQGQLIGRGRIDPAWPQEATLSEAETTLARLRQRQTEAVAAEKALDEIDASVAPARVAEQLAAAGFGPKVKTTADDVLARLKAKTQSGAAA